MIEVQEIATALKKIGFTEYEARVYSALAVLNEATANEIHRVSGVPRTRVYEVLKDLEAKGLVETVTGTPTYFRAIEPDKVLKGLRDNLVRDINNAIDMIKKINYEVPKFSPVWCVRGKIGVKNRLRDILLRTKDDLIVITANPNFLRENISHLKGLDGVRIRVIVDDIKKFSGFKFRMTEVNSNFSFIFRDTYIDGVKHRFESLVISDGRESLGIYQIGDEIMGISIKLPLIAVFQKIIFLGVLSDADDIGRDE
jgi:sugar-specific transcriptional regulator TrmB